MLPKHITEILQELHQPTVGSDYHDQSANEKRLTRKLDLRLIPALYLLCLVSFVDKIAIGNARIAGLEHDILDPNSNQFNVVISLYWIPYILAQIPSNILMKRVHPPLYLGTLAVIFGMFAIHLLVKEKG